MKLCQSCKQPVTEGGDLHLECIVEERNLLRKALDAITGWKLVTMHHTLCKRIPDCTCGLKEAEELVHQAKAKTNYIMDKGESNEGSNRSQIT